jgi:dihydropteroate synthase
MAIINCTPDSFYDGEAPNQERLLKKSLDAIDDGADILDIGGESTRPGAKAVCQEQELDRIVPLILNLRKHTQHPLSVDTSKAKVAEAALKAGANLINDVSAGRDPLMPSIAASFNCPIVLMHMQGKPETMQKSPQYRDLFSDIKHHLSSRSEKFMSEGVQASNIIWDPGIGFGKNLDHNLDLLRNISAWSTNFPILLGTSRKSFISQVDPSADSPNERLPGSLATLSLAQHPSVAVFRVHDVKASRQFLLVQQALSHRSHDQTRR